MKIEPHHIKDKKIVGQLPNGNPVFYVQTHGGLHLMLGNRNGSIENFAAMPHRGMAYWLADKKVPGIQWDRQKLTED